MSHDLMVVVGNSGGMCQGSNPDPHLEYARLYDLHEQKFDSKATMGNVDSKFTSSSYSLTTTTQDTDLMAAFLKARHVCQRRDLVAAHQIELQQVLKDLKNKHDAQAETQYKQHMFELEARWQEPAEDNADLVKKLSALRDEKSQKQRELERVEADIARQRQVLQSLPDVWDVIEGEMQEKITRKRMRT
jgi:predicted  nucleic acid-binding Zn-ribbon protein